MISRTVRKLTTPTTLKCLNSTWFDSYVMGVESTQSQHSKVLAKSDIIYNMEIHDVKPGHLKEYLTNAENVVPGIHKSDQFDINLYGQFGVVYGQQDRIFTIWKHNGYESLENSYKQLKENKDYQDYADAQAKLVHNREQQICYEFSFWPDYVDDWDGGLFEIRTYTLRAGSLYEWAHAWAQGIHLRENDAVMGLSSQIGEMYRVHHVWRYNDMVHRKQERTEAWQKENWGDCVIKTVPLIKSLNVNIIKPTDWSPLR